MNKTIMNNLPENEKLYIFYHDPEQGADVKTSTGEITRRSVLVLKGNEAYLLPRFPDDTPSDLTRRIYMDVLGEEERNQLNARVSLDFYKRLDPYVTNYRTSFVVSEHEIRELL